MTSNELIGKTVTNVAVDGDDVRISATDGEKEYNYIITHIQDCCETVNLVKTDNVYDMLNHKIIDVVENYNQEMDDRTEENYTASKYIFLFRKNDGDTGAATLVWHGHSNGYYSEIASFFECDDDGFPVYW